MKVDNYIRTTAVAVALVTAGGAMAKAPTASEKTTSTKAVDAAADKAAITALFAAYNKALNTSDTAAVIPLYTDDGIFMPPYSASAVGPAAIREAYDNVFRQISFAVRFDVAEIVQVAPDWAFARTNSAGTTTTQGTGAKASEGNQELFVLKKGTDGKWRIARYSFSPTSPPKK